MKITRSSFLLTALAGTTLSCTATAETKPIDVDELDKLLKEGKVFLLDVREPQELKDAGAVKGYVNIPMSQLDSRMSEIPKDKTIVTFCARGRRAATAGEKLTKAGYTVIGCTGINQWKEKKKPVVYPGQ
jgi:rhodanese-related sulfurtransferase